MIFGVISWFLAGFISMIYFWVSDMRGEEFDENYFDFLNICISLLILMFGYFSVIISYLTWASKNKPFTKLIYKLCNIGIKNKENKEGEE